MGVAIAEIVAGLVELLFGRRLFWVFVAIGGFVVGWFLVPAIFHSLASWERILIGVVLGVLFALLATWFTRFMVSVAGFFLFGAVAVVLVRHLGAHASSGSTAYWVSYLIGGIVGALLLSIFFDWALIVLTSLAGAGATAQGIVHFVTRHPLWLEVILLVVFAACGFAYQAWSFRGHGRRLIGRR